MPLAEVRARVAKFAEPVARRFHALGERGLDRRRHHAKEAVLLAATLFAAAVSALVLIGHVQFRRGNARDETRTRRRATRRRDVEVAEAHAVLRELLEVRRETRGPRVRRRLTIHVDRGARPASRLRLDEDEVRTRGDRGRGRGGGLRRLCLRLLGRIFRRLTSRRCDRKCERRKRQKRRDECDACKHVQRSSRTARSFAWWDVCWKKSCESGASSMSSNSIARGPPCA